MPKLDTHVRWRLFSKREVARKKLIPLSLPDSPPSLIPHRLTPWKMRAQLVPREMMGEAASTTPFDGKKEEEDIDFFLL